MSNDTTGVADETSTTPPTNTNDQPDPKPTDTVEFWKNQARENEKRAKANADAAKELDKVKAANMSDLERAIAETKTSTRADVLREVGSERALDAARIALAGRHPDIEGVLEGFAAEAFVNDDGSTNLEKVQKWANSVAHPADQAPPARARVPAGVRDTGTPKATPAQDLAAFMTNALAKG
jgi:hypothetical protein